MPKIKIRGFRGLSPLFRATEPEEYDKIHRKELDEEELKVILAKTIGEIAKLDKYSLPDWCSYLKAKIERAKDTVEIKKDLPDMCCLVLTRDNEVIGFGYIRSDMTTPIVVNDKTYYVLELSDIEVVDVYRGKVVRDTQKVSDIILDTLLNNMEQPICVATPITPMSKNLLVRHGFDDGRSYLNTEDPKILKAVEAWLTLKQRQLIVNPPTLV